MINKKKILVVSIVLWVSLIFLIGCQFNIYRLSKDDIVGVWVNTYPEDLKEDCVYFEFFPDGKFEAHNIPEEYLISQ